MLAQEGHNRANCVFYGSCAVKCPNTIAVFRAYDTIGSAVAAIAEVVHIVCPVHSGVDVLNNPFSVPVSRKDATDCSGKSSGIRTVGGINGGYPALTLFVAVYRSVLLLSAKTF